MRTSCCKHGGIERSFGSRLVATASIVGVFGVIGMWALQSLAADPVPAAPLIAQLPLPPKVGGTVIITPTFTSMTPSPLQLAPGRLNRVTFSGTNMDKVLRMELVNTRTPLWRLGGTRISISASAITFDFDVPKYLAPGPYRIDAHTQSGTYNTGLLAQANEYKPCLVWAAFNPRLHGYAFANDRWGDVCFTLDGIGRLVYTSDGGICGSNWGLCGGMSLGAGERFRSGSLLTHGLSRDAAKPEIVNAQFRTLDGPTVLKFLTWISSPDIGHMTDIHSVGYRMQQDWNGLIKPQLDAYKPVVLGLIFDKTATVFEQVTMQNVGAVTDQHQVLGMGYSRIGTDTVRICAYDPNVPNDILILTFQAGTTGVTQQLDSGNPLPVGRRPARGVMFVRGVP